MNRQDHPPTATETAYSQAVAIARAAKLRQDEKVAVFAAHTEQALAVVAKGPFLADDRDAVYLDDRGEWVR